MRIIEFRIPLPFTVEEYQRGQSYIFAQSSIQENEDSNNAIEVIEQQPFYKSPQFNDQYDTGIRTKMRYKMDDKVGDIWRRVATKNSLTFEEQCHDAYPYVKTVITNCAFPDKFKVVIESLYFDNDTGQQENVFKLNDAEINNRQVKNINIAIEIPEAKSANRSIKSSIPPPTQKELEEFAATALKRGPLLGNNWYKGAQFPIMCIYKLVHIECRYFGFQNMVESRLDLTYRSLFATFNQRVWLSTNEWYNINAEAIFKYRQDALKYLGLPEDQVLENIVGAGEENKNSKIQNNSVTEENGTASHPSAISSNTKDDSGISCSYSSETIIERDEKSVAATKSVYAFRNQADESKSTRSRRRKRRSGGRKRSGK